MYTVINNGSFIKNLDYIVSSYNKKVSLENDLNINKKILALFEEVKANIGEIYKFLSLINEYKNLLVELDEIEKVKKNLEYNVNLIDNSTLLYRISNMFKRNIMANELYQFIADKEYVLESISTNKDKIFDIMNGIKNEDLSNLCSLLLDRVSSFEYKDSLGGVNIEKPKEVCDLASLLQYVVHYISKDYSDEDVYAVNIDLLIAEFTNKVKTLEDEYKDSLNSFNSIYGSINPVVKKAFETDYETCNNLVNLKNNVRYNKRTSNPLISFIILKLVSDTRKLSLDNYKMLYKSDVLNDIYSLKSIDSLESEYSDAIDDIVKNKLSKINISSVGNIKKRVLK